MSRTAIALIAAVILLCVASIAVILQRTRQPAPLAKPQFGWRTLDTAKFELHRVEARVYPLDRSLGGRVKLTVTASAPVSFGFGSERRVRALKPMELAAQKDHGEASITALYCSRFNVISGEAECELNQPRTGMTILVNDERKGASPANDSNQVTFVLSEWTCIANCP